MKLQKKYIGLFYKKLQNEGVAEKSINDFKSHFARWLSLELKKQKRMKKIGALIPKKDNLTSLMQLQRGLLGQNTNEISLYEGAVAPPKIIATEVAKLKAAFPAMEMSFISVLSENPSKSLYRRKAQGCHCIGYR